MGISVSILLRILSWGPASQETINETGVLTETVITAGDGGVSISTSSTSATVTSSTTSTVSDSTTGMEAVDGGEVFLDWVAAVVMWGKIGQCSRQTGASFGGVDSLFQSSS